MLPLAGLPLPPALAHICRCSHELLSRLDRPHALSSARPAESFYPAQALQVSCAAAARSSRCCCNCSSPNSVFSAEARPMVQVISPMCCSACHVLNLRAPASWLPPRPASPQTATRRVADLEAKA